MLSQIHENQILGGNAQILQYSLEPNDFTCGDNNPMYSAYVLDSATIGCFLLLQETAPLPREKTNPDVDHLSVLYLAQSASVYPSSRMIVFDLYMMP